MYSSERMYKIRMASLQPRVVAYTSVEIELHVFVISAALNDETVE